MKRPCQARNQAGSAGLGLLAGVVTFFVLFVVYYYGATWLNANGYLPQGKLSGQEKIPWAIIGLGAPLLMSYASFKVGTSVEERFDAPRFVDGPLALVLTVLIGGFVAFLVIGFLIIIATIYIACVALFLVAIGAAVAGGD